MIGPHAMNRLAIAFVCIVFGLLRLWGGDDGIPGLMTSYSSTGQKQKSRLSATTPSNDADLKNNRRPDDEKILAPSPPPPPAVVPEGSIVTTADTTVTITEFNENCYLSWGNSDDEETTSDDGPIDSHHLGPCYATYHHHMEPPVEGGYKVAIDYFHHRDYGDTPEIREACYKFCLERLVDLSVGKDDDTDHHQAFDRDGKESTPSDAATSYLQDASMLIEAAIMGMPDIVNILSTDIRFGPMDPFEPAWVRFGAVSNNLEKGDNVFGFGYDEKDNTVDVGLNALQQAIIGGHAEALAIMLRAKEETKKGGNLRTTANKVNIDQVIDRVGRTVRDYINMKGSPIRPRDAKKWLGLDTIESQMSRSIFLANGTELSPEAEEDLMAGMSRGDEYPGFGWSTQSNLPVSKRCDMDIIYGSMNRERFYRDYLITGRPFVMRGLVPEEEILAFRKDRWELTESFHPTSKCKVGPTAYPKLTGQKRCKEKFTIEDIEAGRRCEEMPDIPMVHARHPSDKEFEELFPQYEEGGPYSRKSGWRMILHWFRKGIELGERFAPSWQVFFGTDGSGATIHWHKAAMNALYVGRKDWKVTPPHYRGLSGMPADKASSAVDDAISLQCTQGPGDFIFIPNYWGHLTLNHGFAIGAATILPYSFQQSADIKPRILFVHVNKAGGSSMISMLKDRCPEQFYPERWGSDPPQRTFHATAHALIDREGRDAWDNSYTFALVRHPLARVVSNFWFLVNNCRTSKEMCKQRSIPVGLDVTAMTDDEKITAFHEYFHKLYEQYPPGSKDHYLFGSLGHGNEKFRTLNATQTSWMVDEDGNMAVKNIYKLEDLADDMKKLVSDLPCLNKKTEKQQEIQTHRKLAELIMSQRDYEDDDEELGFEAQVVEHDHRALTEMVKKNTTPKYPDYKLFGKNARTNEIMREVFGPDYENFGYKYDE